MWVASYVFGKRYVRGHAAITISPGVSALIQTDTAFDEHAPPTCDNQKWEMHRTQCTDSGQWPLYSPINPNAHAARVQSRSRIVFGDCPILNSVRRRNYGISVGLCRATNKASRVATSSIFHACQRQYPDENNPVHMSSASWTASDIPLTTGESASALLVSRPARRSQYVPACMVAESPMRSFTKVLQSISLPP